MARPRRTVPHPGPRKIRFVMDTIKEDQDSFKISGKPKETLLCILYTIQTHHRNMLHGVDCYNDESGSFMQALILDS